MGFWTVDISKRSNSCPREAEGPCKSSPRAMGCSSSFSFCWGSLPDLQTADFWLCFYMAWERANSGLPSSKGSKPIVRAPPSWPHPTNDLPNAPAPDTITLGVRASKWIWAEDNQLIATTIPSIGQWQVCSRWLPNMLWEKKKNKKKK